jgi:hypothetical protein
VSDNTFPYRTDYLHQLVGPQKLLDDVILDDNASASADLRIFNDQKTHTVAAAQTRLGTAVAATGDTWLVPSIIPAWIEVGDTLALIDDLGERHETTVNSYTPGTDADTIVVAAGAPGAAAIGNAITLIIKATTALVIPVCQLDVAFDQGDPIEVETDTIGTVDDTTVSRIRECQQNENGEAVTGSTRPLVFVLAAGTSAPVSVGRALRNKLGDTLTPMIEYGSPLTNTDTWGYAITVPDDHPGIELGQTLRLEAHFTVAGGGFDMVVPALLNVTEGA